MSIIARYQSWSKSIFSREELTAVRKGQIIGIEIACRIIKAIWAAVFDKSAGNLIGEGRIG